MIVFNNKKFGGYVKEIYPSQLTVEKANTSDDLANYLDLIIIESNNRLYTKLYDERDDFDFHIVNFPFLLSNIPSSPLYGVYISRLIMGSESPLGLYWLSRVEPPLFKQIVWGGMACTNFLHFEGDVYAFQIIIFLHL